MKDFFEQMTDLYDPGPTLLSKYWQFMRLSLSLSLSMCVRVCVRVPVHFKVISVMIGDDCHCKQGVVSIYYNHLNRKYLNRLYQG